MNNIPSLTTNKRMRLPNWSIAIAVGLSIALFFIGLYSWGGIFDLIVPAGDGITYLSDVMSGQFRQSLLFAFVLALVPVTTILIWKLGPIFKTGRKVLVVCFILAGILLFVIVRREIIRARAENTQGTTVLDYTDPNNPQSRQIAKGLSESTLHFDLYALAGLVAGGLIAYYVLRQKPL